jgi:hexosaminidase
MRWASSCVALLIAVGCIAPPPPAGPKTYGEPTTPATRTQLVPFPRQLQEGKAQLELASTARIVAAAELVPIATLLANVLRRSTGFELPIVAEGARPGDIELVQAAELASLGDEGYRLDVTDRVTIKAAKAAGVFYGTVTLRQMLPPEIEASSKQSLAWSVPEAHIEDAPRYGWRGLSLDVARHFMPLGDVQRLIELAAYHKLNRVHVHLTDDQGWRIEIKSWPKLATVGGSSEVGGGPGGFYTQAELAELVAFADARHVVLIPEIDMPGHVQAALASYGELNRSGQPAEPYIGTDVGFSSLVFDDPDTLRFLNDVIREVAALTTGPYLHIGADEAKATKLEDYKAFLKTVGELVRGQGKIAIGWCEAGEAELPPGTLLQDWHPGCPGSVMGAQRGMRIIASPPNRVYLDMQYAKDTPARGTHWAGYVEMEQAYEWEPSVAGVPNEAIIGIESALWTEYVTTRAEADYLIFPRITAHAELGWTGPGRGFVEFRRRLAYHGKRLSALGVGFYRSPQIAW